MLKVPEIPSLKFTTQTSGQNIDDVIKRAVKFHSKRKKYMCIQRRKITMEITSIFVIIAAILVFIILILALVYWKMSIDEKMEKKKTHRC